MIRAHDPYLLEPDLVSFGLMSLTFSSLASPKISTDVLHNSWCLLFAILSLDACLTNTIQAQSTWLDGERWKETVSLAAVCRVELTIKEKGLRAEYLCQAGTICGFEQSCRITGMLARRGSWWLCGSASYLKQGYGQHSCGWLCLCLTKS